MPNQPNKALRLLHIQHGEEGVLGEFDVSDLFHPTFALFLAFQEFPFAGDIAAVTFGGDILPEGFHRFAGDDLVADRGLDGHIEQLPRDHLPQFGNQQLPAGRTPCLGER